MLCAPMPHALCTMPCAPRAVLSTPCAMQTRSIQRALCTTCRAPMHCAPMQRAQSLCSVYQCTVHQCTVHPALCIHALCSVPNALSPCTQCTKAPHTLHMLFALAYVRCTMHSSCEPMHCAQRSLHQNMHCAMHFVHQSTLLCSVHSAPTLSALMLCALKHRAQGSVHQSTMHCAASHAPTQQHPLTIRTAHALYESPPSALRMRPALSTRCAHINPSHCACALCIASLRTAHAQRIT